MERVYLLSGDDTFAKDEYLDKLKISFGDLEKGINYLVFDKDNISMLGEELTTYSFFSSSKLIVVKVPKVKRKSDDENSEGEEKDNTTSIDWYTDDLEDKIQNMIDGIVLIFIEEGTSKSKLFKLVSKIGKVVTFEKKKPTELASWLIAYALSKGIVISKDNAKYLIEVCGSDKILITNEIEKLISYVDNKEITKKDIDDICIVSSEIIIFDLTDNIGERNIKSAILNLEKLLNNKEPIQKILIMITRHFKTLLLTKECLEKGKNVEKELVISSHPAFKYSQQAKNFTKQELVDIFKKLYKLDIDTKTGNIDIKIGLQKILMQ